MSRRGEEKPGGIMIKLIFDMANGAIYQKALSGVSCLTVLCSAAVELYPFASP